MSTITWYERMLHPTTADLYATLKYDHCDFCTLMTEGSQPWWESPNSTEGKEQLDEIGEHILNQYPNGGRRNQ